MSRAVALRLAGAAALLAFCALGRGPLERDPVTHVLVQLPLLAWAGWLAATALRDYLPDPRGWNGGGVAGLLAAFFAMAVWMLPRSIDASLDQATVELAKFASVPLLIGAPLASSWRRAHPLLRGLLKANALSMLGILAFLYSHAPVRLCNNYLASDQERLGLGFLGVALALALLWSLPLFLGGAGKSPRVLEAADRGAPA